MSNGPDSIQIAVARYSDVGSVRLLGAIAGPSRHVLTLQIEVRSRHRVLMSRHIAHIVIHVGAYRF